MSLYKKYIELVKQEVIITGFSSRIPDYATAYWLEQFERVVAGSNKKKFLDIGAGSGRLSVLLASSGFQQGVAVEVDVDHAVWQGHLRRFKNLTLHEGYLQELLPTLLAAGPFDVIVLAEVFEHIPLRDVAAFLAVLKKLLAPEGAIFLTTPNFVTQGPADKSHMWYERQPYGHHKHYTVAEIRNLLAAQDFAIIWHTFECNRKKTVLYNRWYYPAVRFDQKLMHTKKLPGVVRTLYKAISTPLTGIACGVFWVLAKYVRQYEYQHNSEQNAETMILFIKHAPTVL